MPGSDSVAGPGLSIRPATVEDVEEINELVTLSKASWGYSETAMTRWRDMLRVDADDVVARRTVVAERHAGPVGVATLEGSAPRGTLGLLFVHPDAMGAGVGRALYRHVLQEAGRLGFITIVIDADPHAVGFYRRLGAEFADADTATRPLVRMHAHPVRPEPAWRAAWCPADQPVIIGNVARFNAQFLPVAGEALDKGTPDHYSCLATFCAGMPSLVLLPQKVSDWWVQHVRDALGWDALEILVGPRDAHDSTGVRLTDPRDPVRAMEHAVADAVAARAGSWDGPVIAWGLTAGLERLLATPPEVLDVIFSYESKSASNRLFHELAPDHPSIYVPAQRPLTSPRALARDLARGARVVLKSNYGAGGSTVEIVSRDTPGLRGLLRRRARESAFVEEYIEGAGPHRDLTVDAVIADSGVHLVGVALMHVQDTAYRGATVGPDIVPAHLSTAAAQFGLSVGNALEAVGYRGWYDVDFVTDSAGRLAPTEINLRLTGPAAAFHIQATVDQLHGGVHVVRTMDCLPLGARLPDTALRSHVQEIADQCSALGATLIVTIPTAAADPAPYLGVAIAARTFTAVTAAQRVVEQANEDLASLFTWFRRRS